MALRDNYIYYIYFLFLSFYIQIIEEFLRFLKEWEEQAKDKHNYDLIFVVSTLHGTLKNNKKRW